MDVAHDATINFFKYVYKHSEHMAKHIVPLEI